MGVIGWLGNMFNYDIKFNVKLNDWIKMDLYYFLIKSIKLKVVIDLWFNFIFCL